MKAILKTNLPFFFPYLLFIVFGAVLIIMNNKAETHLAINALHHTIFDFLFYYITFLGDGIMAVIVVVMLLAIRFRYALIVGVSNIIASSITQLLKNTLFSDVLRPKKFFEGIEELYFVPGVENYYYNSFPSGHTTCAFALYCSLALILDKPAYKLLFFIIALLVGYSRIYLSQHFFEDVYAGSLIGVVITIFVFYFIQKNTESWYEKSLISVFKN